MKNPPRSRHTSLVVALAMGLLASTVGCGTEEESTDVNEGALSGLVINCPPDVTVNWTQAANGRTNTFHGKARTVVYRDQPFTNLNCHFENNAAPLIQQIVSFKPNSVESVCGANATVSGTGTTANSVPPFEPFIFKSKRVKADSVYDKASGICLLTLPTGPSDYPSLFFGLKVNKGCKTISDTAFLCPADVHQVE